MFHTAVTMKCQGHCKCNEQVKSVSTTIMKSLTLITFIVSEEVPVLKFSTNPDTWPTKNMFYFHLNTHKCSRTIHFVHGLFKVCSNNTMLKATVGKNLKNKFAVYISDTPVTLKQSQGHQTYHDNVDPKQG